VVSADDARDELQDKAPVLVSRLDQHDVDILKNPDPYSLANRMLIQYTDGTTTFTQSELQRGSSWGTSSETAHKRLETLETVGFITVSRNGRAHKYTIKEPVEKWLDDSPITDLPIVASSESVTPVPSATENSHPHQGGTVGPLGLPEPTPERLKTYQNRWAAISVFCFVGGLVLFRPGSHLWFWITMVLVLIGLVSGSATIATFTARQLQNLRSRTENFNLSW